MNEKILFVDDEANVLAGYERTLRRQFDVTTALGGELGLVALAARGPFAVVVSDMRMPGMNGAQFLGQVRSEHPDTVRLLLTGYADVRSAIEAVNAGGLFRFLTKPCSAETLASTLEAALQQYRLVLSEKELLSQTLRGSIQMLGEVLALANPAAFGRAMRLQLLIRDLAPLIRGADAWEIDVAAVLCQLGYVAVPEAILAAADGGRDLTSEERKQLDAAPRVAIDLLSRIPRLERVIEILAHLDQRFDAYPSPEEARMQLPLGARLLKLVRDFDLLVARGATKGQAVNELRANRGEYDPDLVAVLGALVELRSLPPILTIPVARLMGGMIVADDLYSGSGALLLRQGIPITEVIARRLDRLAETGAIAKQIRVFVPNG